MKILNYGITLLFILGMCTTNLHAQEQTAKLLPSVITGESKVIKFMYDDQNRVVTRETSYPTQTTIMLDSIFYGADNEVHLIKSYNFDSQDDKNINQYNRLHLKKYSYQAVSDSSFIMTSVVADSAFIETSPSTTKVLFVQSPSGQIVNIQDKDPDSYTKAQFVYGDNGNITVFEVADNDPALEPDEQVNLKMSLTYNKSNGILKNVNLTPVQKVTKLVFEVVDGGIPFSFFLVNNPTSMNNHSSLIDYLYNEDHYPTTITINHPNSAISSTFEVEYINAY